MNTLDKKYLSLCASILKDGCVKEGRNGRTRSIFGCQIDHNMAEGFPILTTKKMAFTSIVAELTWFLKGRTDIEYLNERNCHIWDGDHKKHGFIGPIYGKQWRDWDGVDQIKNLIKSLKESPDSRRMMVSAWNVDDLNRMCVPPCHHSFQVYTELKPSGERLISLLWNQRSVDVPLGLPFNIASYGLLLMILAKEVDMTPHRLIGSLGDCHIYDNQIEGVKEQMSREPLELPYVAFEKDLFYNYDVEDFRLDWYISHPRIEFPLSN